MKWLPVRPEDSCFPRGNGVFLMLINRRLLPWVKLYLCYPPKALDDDCDSSSFRYSCTYPIFLVDAGGTLVITLSPIRGLFSEYPMPTREKTFSDEL